MFLLGDLVSFSLIWRLSIAALLWVLLHLLIRFHPRGIEIVGGIVCILGFCWWYSDVRQFPPYAAMILLTGFGILGIGRFLYQLRKRQ
jgi:hypothetical protein